MCNVLVVDDEPLVLALLTRALREAGYSTIAAENGATALEAVRGGETPIDVLLTDLKMHGMSGQQVAAAVKALRPEVRVVYMSGFSDRASLAGDALAGCEVFLEKPFNTKALLATMARVLPQSMVPK